MLIRNALRYGSVPPAGYPIGVTQKLAATGLDMRPTWDIQTLWTPPTTTKSFSNPADVATIPGAVPSGFRISFTQDTVLDGWNCLDKYIITGGNPINLTVRNSLLGFAGAGRIYDGGTQDLNCTFENCDINVAGMQDVTSPMLFNGTNSDVTFTGCRMRNGIEDYLQWFARRLTIQNCWIRAWGGSRVSALAHCEALFMTGNPGSPVGAIQIHDNLFDARDWASIGGAAGVSSGLTGVGIGKTDSPPVTQIIDAKVARNIFLGFDDAPNMNLTYFFQIKDNLAGGICNFIVDDNLVHVGAGFSGQIVGNTGTATKAMSTPTGHENLNLYTGATVAA